MKRDDILMIGIGGAGNAIVNDFLEKDKRYNHYCINTNYSDMSSLKNITNKYVIPFANGTSKRRSLAKEFAKSKIGTIVDNILNGFVLQERLYILFSLDGGSGSGISPSLIRILSRKCKKLYPNKTFNIICTLPKYTMSATALSNAIECWNELAELIENEQINSIFMLDNNKRDNVQDINKEFIELFDDFIDAPQPDVRGIIDGAEMDSLFTAKGMSYIFKADQDINELNYVPLLDEIKKQSVFADYRADGSEMLGVVAPKEISDEILFNSFGETNEIFRGYTNNYISFAVMGCPVNTSPIELIQMRLHDKQKSSKKIKNKNLKIEMLDDENDVKNIVAQDIVEEDDLTIEDLEDMFY